MVFNMLGALSLQNRFSVNRVKAGPRNGLNRFFVYENNASYQTFAFFEDEVPISSGVMQSLLQSVLLSLSLIHI